MQRLYYIGLSLFMIAADQISKWWVSESVLRPDGQGLLDWYLNTPERLPFAQVEIWPFFNVVMVWNKGVSFGLFNHETDYGPLLLIGLSLIITAWFLVWMMRATDRLQSIGLALVVGGALGNVIDRLRFGAVIDFFDFHIFDNHWPAFNIADSCIVIGVGVLILQSFLGDGRKAGNN